MIFAPGAWLVSIGRVTAACRRPYEDAGTGGDRLVGDRLQRVAGYTDKPLRPGPKDSGRPCICYPADVESVDTFIILHLVNQLVT